MQLQKIVNQENQKCWGKPLGSENLWKGHVETIERIQQMATQIKIKEVGFGPVFLLFYKNQFKFKVKLKSTPLKFKKNRLPFN